MKEIPLDFTIQTERLLLRAVDVTDIDLVWSASQIDGFNEGLTWNPPKIKSELIEAVNRNKQAWSAGETYMFTSVLSEGDKKIGRTGISRTDSESVWGFGFWVHPDYWGNGYATEAGRAVLDFGFTVLNASKIISAHAIWNSRSKKVIEKLGFEYTGENPCGFMKNDKPVAEYEYEILQTAR